MEIIINGDIKHEFGTISEQEWRHTLRLLDFLSRYCDEVILIKGNHDMILGPIAKKRNVKVLEYYVAEPIAVESINEKNTITASGWRPRPQSRKEKHATERQGNHRKIGKFHCRIALYVVTPSGVFLFSL